MTLWENDNLNNHILTILYLQIFMFLHPIKHKFSYCCQSIPIEGHSWNWLNNFIELFFLRDLYLYKHICYESCKTSHHHFNCKIVVLTYHATALVAGRDYINHYKNQKVPVIKSKILTWSPWYLSFEGLHFGIFLAFF